MVPRQAINSHFPDDLKKAEVAKIQGPSIQVHAKIENKFIDSSATETKTSHKEANLGIQENRESQQRVVMQNHKRARETTTNDQQQPEIKQKVATQVPQNIQDIRSDISKLSIRDRFVKVRQSPRPRLELKPDDTKTLTKPEEIPTKSVPKPAKHQNEEIRSERSSKILAEHQNYTKSKLERNIENAKDRRVMLDDVKILQLPDKKFKAKLTDLSLFLEKRVVTICEYSDENNKFYATIQEKINQYVADSKLNEAESHVPM